MNAAGWYPDPYFDGRRRWWDGQRWTERTHPVGEPEPEGPAAGPGGGATLPPTSVGTPTSALASAPPLPGRPVPAAEPSAPGSAPGPEAVAPPGAEVPARPDPIPASRSLPARSTASVPSPLPVPAPGLGGAAAAPSGDRLPAPRRQPVVPAIVASGHPARHGRLPGGPVGRRRAALVGTAAAVVVAGVATGIVLSGGGPATTGAADHLPRRVTASGAGQTLSVSQNGPVVENGNQVATVSLDSASSSAAPIDGVAPANGTFHRFTVTVTDTGGSPYPYNPENFYMAAANGQHYTSYSGHGPAVTTATHAVEGRTLQPGQHITTTVVVDSPAGHGTLVYTVSAGAVDRWSF